MKVKSLCSLTEAAGAEGAVKTAIKYQIGNSTDLVPHHAAKSTIVRGALELHLAYRWFCRLGLDDKVPHHSTFSENLNRFRESDILRHIFERVVMAATSSSSNFALGQPPTGEKRELPERKENRHV